MPRKYFTAEQIIGKLREAEVLISQGKTTADAGRDLVPAHLRRCQANRFQSL